MMRLVDFLIVLKNTLKEFQAILMFLILRIIEEMIERKQMELQRMVYQVLMVSFKDVEDCKQARRNQ